MQHYASVSAIRIAKNINYGRLLIVAPMFLGLRSLSKIILIIRYLADYLIYSRILIGFYKDCGGILAALIIIGGYKNKIKKKFNKRGDNKAY